MTELIDALQNRRIVEMTYGDSTKKRKIEIYLIGVSASNPDEILIRAYERFKEFKLFKYHKMKNIKVLNQTHSSYNRIGYKSGEDTAMAEVLFHI